jgi:large repetitive protein
MLGRSRRSRLFRSAIAVVTSLMLVVALAGFVSAANDGAGTMTVTPGAVGAGTTNSFAFTFTNNDNNAFGANSIVTWTVPAGWTAPTNGAGAGHISLSANGCTATIASVVGMVVTVNQTCPRDSSFTLNYATATAPAAAGTATFTTASRNGATGLTNIDVQPVVILYGAATKVVFTQQPTSTTAGTAIAPSVTVAVEDAGNRVVTSSTASITVAIGNNPGGSTLSGTATVNAIAGVATFAGLSLNRPGNAYTLTAASGVLTGATSSAFNITVGAANKLAFTVQPTNTVAGASITPSVAVTIQDVAGNTVNSTANVTIAIGTNPGGGTLTGTATRAAVAGVATFPAMSINRAGTGYTLTAASGVLTGATSSTFNITVGAANKVVFTQQPTNTTAGASITPSVAVTIQDVAGNTVNTNANVTVAIGTNPGGGTLSGTLTQAAVAGVATFPGLSINRSGTGYTLTAASAGLTGATSSAFNITAGAASTLVFSQQPSDTTAGANITPNVTVTIQDAYGNTVNSTANITLAIGNNPGTGTLSGTVTRAAVAGVATFTGMSINKTGTGYTLTASGAGATGATSNAFNILAGAPDHLAFGVQPTNTLVNAAISPAVTVIILDAYDNVVTGSSAAITVELRNEPNGVNLNGTLTVNAVAGIATFSNLSVDGVAPGVHLRATGAGATRVSSNDFNVTAPLVPLTVTMYKVICPSYSVVPANENPSNADATGGHWSELASGYLAKPVVPARDIPTSCQPVPGWTWDFRNGQFATVNISTYTTGSNGYVSVDLNPTELALARGGGLWVQEEMQASAPFGSIRCYNDVLNGDNLENIQNVDSAVTQIYCVAYNVAPTSLSISKSASGPTYDHVGQVVGYNYVLTNSGNVPLFAPYTVTDNNVDAAPVCPAVPANIAAGESVICSASRTVTQADLDAGSITNVADGHATFASGLVNSLTSATATVTAVTRPGLTLAKIADVTTFTNVGDVINYTYTITNTGNVTLTAPFSLSDSNPGAVCPTVTSLAPGADFTCTLARTVTQIDIDNGVIPNLAVAHATFGASTIDSNLAGVIILSTGQFPSVDLTKTTTNPTYSDVGDILHYTITLTNTGNVTLTNPSVSDPSVGNLDCGTLPATLAPGAHIDCTASHTVTQADLDALSVTNIATGGGGFNGSPVGDGDGVASTAIQNPHLSISKVAGQASYGSVGDVITYTIVLTNDGNMTLSTPSVSDPFVGDLDCGSLPATLAPGAHIDCTASHTITQSDLDAGQVSNTATGHGFLNTNPVSSDPDTAIVLATGLKPSLSITKNQDLATYGTVGQVIHYTIVLTNNGNVTLSNPDVTDAAVGDLDCGLVPATLAPAATINCTASHTVTLADLDAGSFYNTANGAAAFNGIPVTTSTGVESFAVAAPHFSLTKLALQSTFNTVGQVVGYTIALTNDGNVTLTGVTVTDPAADFDCGSAVFPATLAPGASINCTASHTITQADLDGGSVSNTATASGSFGSTPLSATSTAGADASQNPSLNITKVANPLTYGTAGQVINFTIVLTNNGNVTLTNPDVTDAAVTNLDCGTLPATLAPGAHIDCTASHTITQTDIDDGSVTNTAVGTASFGSTDLAVRAGATATASQTASITIAKTPSRATYTAAGQVIGYTITLTNDGNVVVTNPSVGDPSVGNLDCGTLPATLAPGASINCTASYTVTQADLDAGTTIANTANGAASFGTTNLSATDSVQTTAAQNPSVGITKAADPTTFNTVGQVIGYTIVLTNNGNVTLTNPSVSDPSVSNLDCGTLPATLAPGAHIDCTASHTVTQTDLDAGTISNTVTGTAHFVDATVTDTASATSTTTIHPELTIHKTSTTADFAAVGDPIVYSYLLTNTGNVTLDGPFTVDDDKVGVTCPDTVSLAPAGHITCTATYNVVQADIDAGHVTNLATGHAGFGGKVVDTAQTNLSINVQGTQPTPTPFESVGGATAPGTTTGGDSGHSGDSGVPVFALLICLAFGALTLLTVQAQRSGIRR